MKSLEEFEKYRNEHGLDILEKSNAFYNVSNGIIGVHAIDEIDRDLTIENGSVQTGDTIIGVPYQSFVVKDLSTLRIDKSLELDCDGIIHVHGKLILEEDSVLSLKNGVLVTFYPDSEFTLINGSHIELGDGSRLYIYGKMNVSLSVAEEILNNENIVIDAIATINVTDINLGKRIYSLTDYEKDLREKFINYYTQGEYNSGISTMGYTWVNGSMDIGSQVIDLSILWSKDKFDEDEIEDRLDAAVLGDFKLQCLGSQIELVQNVQVVRNLKIHKGSKLRITTSFGGYEYKHPELYVGTIIGNTSEPGDCIVEGTLIADSPDSIITLDRGGTLHISEGGVVDLSNGAILRCTHIIEDEPDGWRTVLQIDGTLLVDRLDQLEIPISDIVKFGEKGKLIVRNVYDERTILFSTPMELRENGIKESDVDLKENSLYKIFRDTIEHIEYHIPSNCGIRIDKYYENYASQMTQWYAGRRIEQALKDGLIVWEGGFIELDSSIIPWANINCTLLDIARLFKNTAATDSDRLQEVVNHMMYCGTGNIAFHIIEGNWTKHLVMRMEKPEVDVAINVAGTDRYRIRLEDGSAYIFARNKVWSSKPDVIVSNDSKVYYVMKEDEIDLL